ncbi:hypothetical protein [Reinekea sp. G2M2-21]|uniref:hypothetical protein n=1 Tax=Reinekea sp. G2M2-21 TaxID=2788942 RepID=UPI0018ABDE59|nr:hypothetical protein [Reinekea sp. G2M2-21]
MTQSIEIELRANFLQKFDECLKQENKGREYYESQAAGEIEAQENRLVEQLADLKITARSKYKEKHVIKS